MSTELWVDRHIPHTMDDYVWRDNNMRKKFEEWLVEGALPHLLFSGKAGLGKTSLAKLLLKLLNVPAGDILFVKTSRERKIDELEARVLGFVQTYPMLDNLHGIKYIILDEADTMSLLAQKFLRTEMEHYAATTRFILTCNYPQKIEPAILSRCQQFHFEALDQENFIARLAGVLDVEKVNYEIDVLVEYIEEAYPDLRRAIGLMQKNVIGGVLQPRPKADGGASDYLFEVMALFAKNKHTEARKMIVAQANSEEYPEVFRWFYDHLELFGDTQDQQDDALVIIRDGLYRHSFVADPEINMSATICELARLSK